MKRKTKDQQRGDGDAPVSAAAHERCDTMVSLKERRSKRVAALADISNKDPNSKALGLEDNKKVLTIILC